MAKWRMFILGIFIDHIPQGIMINPMIITCFLEIATTYRQVVIGNI